jgi:hypothetical protein
LCHAGYPPGLFLDRVNACREGVVFSPASFLTCSYMVVHIGFMLSLQSKVAVNGSKSCEKRNRSCWDSSVLAGHEFPCRLFAQ